MMDEAYLVEHIKDALCFVSQDVGADLALARQRQSPHRCAPAAGAACVTADAAAAAEPGPPPHSSCGPSKLRAIRSAPGLPTRPPAGASTCCLTG